MIEIPAIPDIASAAVLIGALFVVRTFVAMRRIRMSVGGSRGFGFGDCRRATRPLAFGPDLEPERRHAARQLYAGLAFLALGLVLFAWLLTLDVLGPFFVKGNLA